MVDDYFSILEKAETMKWGTNLKAHFGGKVIVDEEDKNTNKSIQLENQ